MVVSVLQGVINDPPVLNLIGDRTIDEGSLLTFTATATDPDAGDMLTYSLDLGFPAGASIDPLTGVFTWTTSDGPATANVTLRVTDPSAPAPSGEETAPFLPRFDPFSPAASEDVDLNVFANLTAPAPREERGRKAAAKKWC